MKTLQKLTLVILAAGMLARGAFGATEPVATVSIKSFDAVVGVASKVMDAVQPGAGAAMGFLAPMSIGSPSMAGIDRARPWEIAVWNKGMMAEPVIALYVPISDFKAFKDGLAPGILKGEWQENSITERGDWAILMEPSEERTEADLTLVNAYNPSPASSLKHALNIVLQPDEASRNQLNLVLSQAQMMAGFAMASGGGGAPSAGDIPPEVLQEMIGIYFEFFGVIVEGMERFEIGLDANDSNIELHEYLNGVPGSVVAGWLEETPGSIAEDISLADWSSPVAFVYKMGEDEAIIELVGKFMDVATKISGGDGSEMSSVDTGAMMTGMLPSVFSGAADIGEGFKMGGSYRFLEEDVESAYQTLLKFSHDAAVAQTGEDKMYSSAKFEKGVRQVEGRPVDRLTINLNYSHPFMDLPGQKEQMEAFYPNGKFVTEYLESDDRLYFSSGKSIEDFIIKTAPGNLLTARSDTFAIMKFDMKSYFESLNSMMPPELGFSMPVDVFQGDSSIVMKGHKRGTFHGEVLIPLSLVKSMVEFQKRMMMDAMSAGSDFGPPPPPPSPPEV